MKLNAVALALGSIGALPCFAGGIDFNPVQVLTAVAVPVLAANVAVGSAAGKAAADAAPGPVGGVVAAITSPLTATDQCLKSLGWKDCSDAAKAVTPVATQVDLCLSNVRSCPQNLVKTLSTTQLLPAAMQVIQNYKQGLVAQASDKWQPLPDEFISAYSYAYPGINLREIRFATGINTVHGAAITFGPQIFIPGKIDLGTRQGRELLLHEIEHTAQYARKGGERPFLDEYLRKGVGQIIACGCFNVHDAIDLERDAASTASATVDSPTLAGRLAFATGAAKAWWARQ